MQLNFEHIDDLQAYTIDAPQSSHGETLADCSIFNGFDAGGWTSSFAGAGTIF